jgi:hypothetical protein
MLAGRDSDLKPLSDAALRFSLGDLEQGHRSSRLTADLDVLS